MLLIQRALQQNILLALSRRAVPPHVGVGGKMQLVV